MCIINWIIAKYYDHQFLKSIPDDYNDETNIPIVLDNKDYIIHIQGRENKTPQFHILDANNNEICSISLVEPRYINISTRCLQLKKQKN